MSRKPDSRRTPGLLMGMPPPPGTSPYEVEVGDPRRVPPAPPNMQSLQHAAHAAHAQGFPLGHVAPGSQPMGNYPGRPVAAPLSPDAVGNYPGRPGHHGQAQVQAAQAAQAQARGCYPNRAAAPGEEPWKPPDHLKPAPAPAQGEGQGEGGGVVVLDGAPVRARMPPQLATTVAAPVGPNGAMTTAIGEVEYGATTSSTRRTATPSRRRGSRHPASRRNRRSNATRPRRPPPPPTARCRRTPERASPHDIFSTIFSTIFRIRSLLDPGLVCI